MSSLETLFGVKGRVAVVTGGGTGIGFNIAEGLVANGAKVYITGRRENKLQDAVKKLNAIKPDSAQYVVSDVTKKADIDSLAKFVESKEESLDILVNNAGAFLGPDPQCTHESTVKEVQEALGNVGIDPAVFQQTILTNAWSPFTLSGAFVGLLAKAAKKGEGRGVIINISSLASMVWNPWWSMNTYSTSKVALNHLSKILGAKLFPHGIRVNVICPGSFISELNDPNHPMAHSHKDNMKRIPLHRNGEPDDIAGTVIYLSSKAGSYVTAAELFVDGGTTLVANGLSKLTP